MSVETMAGAYLQIESLKRELADAHRRWNYAKGEVTKLKNDLKIADDIIIDLQRALNPDGRER